MTTPPSEHERLRAAAVALVEALTESHAELAKLLLKQGTYSFLVSEKTAKSMQKLAELRKVLSC